MKGLYLYICGAGAHKRSPRLPRPNNPHGTHYNLAWQQQRVSAAEGSIMPLVGHGLGILGLEEPPDVLPVLEVVLRAQVEVKAKLEVLEELAPARASGNELTPGGSELAPAAAQQLPELTAAAGRLERGGQGVESGGQRSLDSPGGGMVAEVGVPARAAGGHEAACKLNN